MENTLIRPSSNADHLGRYYTAKWVSESLVDQLQVCRPRLIMELGAGAGSLSRAAHSRWKSAEIITVDLDSRIFETLHRNDPLISHTHHVHDVLDYHLDRKIDLECASVDVALCNPPYIRPRWRLGFEEILEEAGLTGALRSIHDAGADLLFIAQNLRFLRSGGKLGVILPDGLITGEKYFGVRKNLITKQTIRSVIQLPKTAFSRTEAQTYLVILEKSPNKNEGIQLFNFDAPGVLSTPILIDQQEAELRLDYRHHNLTRNKKVATKSTKKIADYCVSIIRGNLSSVGLAEVTYPVFHLSNFTKNLIGKEIDLPKSLRLTKSMIGGLPEYSKVAQPGDILIARVGRGLEYKVCMIKSGCCVISDCVFALRIEEKNRRTVFNHLVSHDGRNALSALSRGVGANYISKGDVLSIVFKP